MRKLILQIRHTIFSRSLCVRNLQTILPYSPYLHGIFAFYSNFSPPTRIYFCKAESFLLNWNLLFQFTLLFQTAWIALEILGIWDIALHKQVIQLDIPCIDRFFQIQRLPVRARLPAKPMISVSGREPRAMEFRKCGPAAGPKEMGKVKNKKTHAAAG